MSVSARQRQQVGTTTGDCSVCLASREFSVWESWVSAPWPLRGRRDVRRSLRCDTCGYRVAGAGAVIPAPRRPV